MNRTKLIAEESADLVEVVLEGGPEMPSEMRRQRVTSDDYKVKICYNGGHEHFERHEADGAPVVFRWTGRTRIAE